MNRLPETFNQSSSSRTVSLASMVALVLLALLTVAFSGCGGDESATADDPQTPVVQQNGGQAVVQPPPDPASFEDGLTATDIWNQCRAQYKAADSYSDKASLYLSYWLDGSPVQEPHQWAVTWRRSGKLEARFYNSRIQCDGNRLSCYVFDNETANLDGQRVLLPASEGLPFTTLFADPLARHFCGGASELPLNTSQMSQRAMIPPTVGLLGGQEIPEWADRPGTIFRMADSKIEEKKCFVVRIQPDPQQQLDIWIDQRTGIIRQISYPVSWLGDEVNSAAEISRLQLVARFQNATFNNVSDDTVFEIKTYKDSTPVSNFVTLPERIPAETIGQTAPVFELATTGTRPVKTEMFRGRTTALMWIAGPRSYKAIDKLAGLRDSLTPDGQNERERFDFGVIYADENLAMDNGLTAPNQQLGVLQQKTRLPFYFDFGLNASALLKVKAVPAIVVLDRNLKVQFARPLSDDRWVDDVNAAMRRVDRGDDIATEMLDEYRRFLDRYHSRMLVAGSGELGADLMPGNAVVRTAQNFSAAAQIWEVPLKMPGNITTTDDGRILVLDGWRTIVELTPDGTVKQRFEIDLPDHAGVSSLRTITDSAGKLWTAAFMPSVPGVYLLDDAMNIANVYSPEHASSPVGVLDCRLYSTTSGDVAMAVSFAEGAGVQHVSVPQLSSLASSDAAFHSLADDGRYGVSFAQIKKTAGDNPESLPTPDGMYFSRLRFTGSDYVATSTSAPGKWVLSGFKKDLTEKWTRPVGGQAFDNNIDPIAFPPRGRRVLAIAGDDGSIEIVSGNGEHATTLKAPAGIAGIAIVNRGPRTILLTSAGDRVTAREIELPTARTQPASHQNR